MKTLSLLVIAMSIAVFAQAQTTQTSPATPPAAPSAAQAKPLAQTISWLAGNWEGEGVSPGEQEFIGKMTANPELDDEAVLLRRESVSKPGSPSGGKKEIMVIGMDGTTKKVILTLHTSNNFIGIYSGEMKQNEIVFTLVTSQQGYVNRRTFKLLPDGGLSFVIEGGSPDKPVGKLVEINFRKK